MLAALPDHFVARRMRDKVGESFHRHGIAIADDGFDGFGQ
jgi:hypothetical protein